MKSCNALNYEIIEFMEYIGNHGMRGIMKLCNALNYEIM